MLFAFIDESECVKLKTQAMSSREIELEVRRVQNVWNNGLVSVLAF